ncbi:putative ABC transport system permease protein [Catenuloplanes nepalensis]|uniref:ABC transport system permease protein n=1 Tax=Catenuloplanes nepalensis TaxID=587533 RepID=A0ABT9MXR6_9ACTN|nr:FtsX-like permease family protein [Catenuloplanes nepalensis]MDP9796213.1 putative ABC transport system permease protein [Catenuloplanes nepalensis]
MRSWLTALRISRREMRRARGRSALVIAMIAVPVCALGYAAASYDMLTLTPRETVTRKLGAADALLQPRLTEPIVQGADGEQWMPAAAESESGRGGMTEAEALDVLPAGSRVVPMAFGGEQFRTADGGLASAEIAQLDLADPIFQGMAELLDGRAPAAPGEVAMSEAARARFGDTIASRERDRSWTVVGTMEFHADLGEFMVFPPGTFPEPGGVGAGQWLADTPEPVDWVQVNQINRKGVAVTSRAVLLDPPDPSITALPWDEGQGVGARGVSLVTIVSGLAMLEIILLAGPAFAVGARRRQRSLALVAANGGTRAHLRRIVLADGLTLGLTGAVMGVVTAVLLAVLARPVAEEMVVGARFGGYRFNLPMLAGIVLLAVLTGLLAAAVPAFTAARADVVAALTGRRGVVRSKRRWLITGLVLTAAGAAVAAIGPRDSANWGAVQIVSGLVLAQLGLVLCTPSLVGLIARLGGALPPAPRIALRDTARNRASSAPAVSAVMAAVAGTVAIGVYLVSTTEKEEAGYLPGLPAGYVGVGYENYREDYDRASEGRARAAVERLLPGATVTEMSEVTCPDQGGYESCYATAVPPPVNRCPGDENEPAGREQVLALAEDPRCERAWHFPGPTFRDAVGGRETLVALTGASGADLDRAVAVLDRGGVVVGDPSLLDDGMALLQVGLTRPGADAAESREITVPGHLLESGRFGAGAVLSPAVVRQAGLASTPAGLVVATGTAPDVAEIDKLNLALAEAGSGSAFVERGPGGDESPMLRLLAAASTLITLGAAGIATGLAAADGRADLSTLAAIGAAPRVRRLLSLSQSGVIAGLGSLLGVAAGIGSAFAVLAARNVTIAGAWPLVPLYPLAVPWANLGLILVVPLVAMLGAGLLTRSRLPIERRRPT